MIKAQLPPVGRHTGVGYGGCQYVENMNVQLAPGPEWKTVCAFLRHFQIGVQVLG